VGKESKEAHRHGEIATLRVVLGNRRKKKRRPIVRGGALGGKKRKRQNKNNNLEKGELEREREEIKEGSARLALSVEHRKMRAKEKIERGELLSPDQ